jgi:hypothetical protein
LPKAEDSDNPGILPVRRDLTPHPKAPPPGAEKNIARDAEVVPGIRKRDS